jgi:membrane-bound metal-dependent hydrolase YbcI (DUF457 family)
MPSPIGHAIAGLAVAWGADLYPGDRAWRFSPSTNWYRRVGGGLTIACAVLAAAPDLDLFFGRFHRTVTHSLLSVAVVALVAGLIGARARLPVTRVVVMCACAWGSHVLLDWLGADQSVPRGIQLLWPFDGRWFISGWDVFPGSERRNLFSPATMRMNVRAITQELVILAPIVVVLWLVRVKTLTRFSSQLARGDHPPQ